MPLPGEQHNSAVVTNPFEEPVQRVSEYTAQEIATLQSRLDKRLGPEFISSRPGAGGGKVHYIAAEKVIGLANEVFGFNGWSSAIQTVQVDFVDECPNTGKITLGLSTIVRVTLKDGTYHEDIGYGHIENCKGKAAAFEKAKKEAVTDALKRALRNFGNVLGNCLYDKDYLGRITKVKVAPSKWDEANLHRHPDYAPIKREPIVTESSSDRESKPESVPTVLLNVSSGTEIEDEFGGNLFDEVDFSESHTDGVKLEAGPDAPGEMSVIKRPGSPLKNELPPHMRHAVPRMQSMPSLRPPNGAPGGQTAQQAGHPQQQRPQPPLRPPQTPNSNVNSRSEASRAHLAQQNMNNPIPNPPQFQGQPQRAYPQNTTKADLPRSNLSSNPETANQRPKPAMDEPSRKSTPPTAGPLFAPPAPQEAPIGFMDSRAADILQKVDTENSTVPPKIAVPSFNPHAQSPSLRRTNGINHNTSAPISRQAIGAGQQGHTNGGEPAMAPRTNFVNPQADVNRKIGMPNAQSPLANRSLYKPPGPALKRGVEHMAQRTPLADVSNMQLDLKGADSGGDMKRQRA